MQATDQLILDTNFSLTLREVLLASALGTYRRLWWIYLSTAIETPVFLYFIPGASSIVLACAYWVLLLLLPFARPLYSMSSPKAKALLTKEVRIEIDANSIKVYAEGELRGTLKLAEMLKAVKIGGFWLLSATRTFNYVIPRRLFNSEQELAFDQALRNHQLLK